MQRLSAEFEGLWNAYEPIPPGQTLRESQVDSTRAHACRRLMLIPLPILPCRGVRETSSLHQQAKKETVSSLLVFLLHRLKLQWANRTRPSHPADQMCANALFSDLDYQAFCLRPTGSWDPCQGPRFQLPF